jgi:hypothetical protein
MPRLVHLARASALRGIERAGIRGARTFVLAEGERTKLEDAVYAMPVLPDFSVTHQWTRELRRVHDERMIAVYFSLSSDAEVLVGRYNLSHARLPLGDAIARLMRSPMGCELIVPRSIVKREVKSIREIRQLVGWTELPEAERKFDCLCAVCVAPGTRDLMHRVRAAFERHVLEARRATTTARVVDALNRLDAPLERARGRIAPDKLIAFAHHRDAEVRRAAVSLFGWFRSKQVAPILAQLSADRSSRVSEEAARSLSRSKTIR